MVSEDYFLEQLRSNTMYFNRSLLRTPRNAPLCDISTRPTVPPPIFSPALAQTTTPWHWLRGGDSSAGVRHALCLARTSGSDGKREH